jgi:hypothetical protein
MLPSSCVTKCVDSRLFHQACGLRTNRSGGRVGKSRTGTDIWTSLLSPQHSPFHLQITFSPINFITPRPFPPIPAFLLRSRLNRSSPRRCLGTAATHFQLAVRCLHIFGAMLTLIQVAAAKTHTSTRVHMHLRQSDFL